MNQNTVREFPAFPGFGPSKTERLAVILAGGDGSRLKSLTRAILAWFPKHKLTEEQASAVIAQIAEQRIIAINGTTIVYPPLAPSNQLTMLQ